jgi:hypothetical protein
MWMKSDSYPLYVWMKSDLHSPAEVNKVACKYTRNMQRFVGIFGMGVGESIMDTSDHF